MKEKGDLMEYHARLLSMRKESDALFDCYDMLQEEAGCEGCERLDRGCVELHQDRHRNCTGCRFYQRIFDVASRLDVSLEETDRFIETSYAKAVFEKYAPTKPTLTARRTGETISWEEVFGADFVGSSRDQRFALVGLSEGTGKYALK